MTFSQYPGGPRFPWAFFYVNLLNANAHLVEARRSALRNRKWESRPNREWNARRYLERKRDLLHLRNQDLTPPTSHAEPTPVPEAEQ